MKRLITVIMTVFLLFNSSLTVNVARADEYEENDAVKEVFEKEETESSEPETEEESLEETTKEQEEVPDDEYVIEEFSEETEDYVVPELSFVEDRFDNSGLLHDEVPEYKKVLQADNLPASFQLDSNALTDIRSQGTYGTCWSFSTIASIESTYKKDNGVSLDLSELHLAHFAYNNKGIEDCLGLITNDGGTPGSNYLSAGGNYYVAMYTMASGIGLVEESELPYSDIESSIDSSICYDSDYIVKDVKLFSNTERNTIKKAIYDDGGVSTSIYFDQYYLYFGAYYYNGNSATNHAVTLVGWDDNYSKDNFKSTLKPSNNGAWLVRNSWGTDFANDGYFWLSYEDTSLSAGTAAQFFVEENDIDRIYQYDGSAGTYKTLTYPGDTVSTANIYQAEEDEDLIRVGFFTYQTNVNYEIKIYKKTTAMSSPTDGTLISQSTTSGTAPDAGYHTVTLEKKARINEDEYFSVVVKMTKSGGVELRFDISEDFVKGITFINTCADGESYLKPSGSSTWIDCYNIGKEFKENTVHGSARIKAFTVDQGTCEHEYDLYNIEWKWDGDTAKLVLHCIYDASHTYAINGVVSSTVTAAPGKTTQGNRKYTAKAVYDGITFTNTRNVEIPAIGGDKTVSEYGICGDDATYVIFSDKTMTISGNGKIDRPFYNSGSTKWSTVERIKIDSSITEIGNSMFKNMTNLNAIYIPSGTTIKPATAVESCFYGCNDNKGIIYTDAESESEEDWSFNWCAIEASSDEIRHGTYVHYNTPADEFEYWVEVRDSAAKKITLRSDIDSLPSGAFRMNRAVEEVVLSSGLEEIPSEAFSYCSALKKVTIPATVESIQDYAFEYCTALKKIYIPSSVVHMGNRYGDGQVFRGCDEDLIVYISSAASTGQWSANWNCYNEELDRLTIETYEANPAGFTFVYDSSTEGYAVESYSLVYGFYPSIPEIYEGIPVTKIKSGAFANKSYIFTLTIPESVTVIEDGAFTNTPCPNEIFYQGRKEVWDEISFDEKSTIMENADVTFSNGKYDSEYGITVYQSETKDIIIEGDAELLESIAEPDVNDYRDGSYESGGDIYLNNHSITNRLTINRYFSDGEEVIEREEQNYYSVEDGRITIPYSYICIMNLPDGETEISLSSSNDYFADFTFNIEGCKKLEEQPVITLLENGDLKIEADYDYLKALMYVHENRTEHLKSYEGSDGGTVVIKKSDSYEGISDYSYNYKGRIYQKFTLSSDATYVIYSNTNQFNPYRGAIINGFYDVILMAYGYEVTEPVNLEFKHNLRVAPTDVTAAYDEDSYCVEITSTDTEWLKQIKDISAKRKDGENAGRYSYTTNYPGIEVINNTCYIYLTGFTLDDGTYDIAVYCGGRIPFSSDEQTECNKTVLTDVEIEDIPSRKYEYPNISFDRNGLVIESDNSEYLNSLTRIKTGAKSDQELLDYTETNNGNTSYIKDSFVVVKDSITNTGVVIRNTALKNLITVSGNKATVSYETLEELGLKIYKGNWYYVYIGSLGYNFWNNSASSSYVDSISKVPNDLRITENSNGDIVITAANRKYLNNIKYVALYEDGIFSNVSASEMDFTVDGKVTVPAELLELDNTTYNLWIQSYGFEELSDEITLEHHGLLDTPEIEIENFGGDLYIHSDDENWIAKLASVTGDLVSRISYTRADKNENRYSGTYGDSGEISSGLVPGDKNTVVFEKKSQIDNGMMCGNYEIQFRVSGYRLSERIEVSLTNATEPVPDDLSVSVRDGHIYVSSEDTDFIRSIKSENYSSYLYHNPYPSDNKISNAYAINWSIYKGYQGFRGVGGAFILRYTEVTKNEDEGVAEFEFNDSNRITSLPLYLFIMTDGTYQNVRIPLENEVRSINYHNDLGYTEKRLDYLHYYTEGADDFTYTLKDPVIPGYTFAGWYTDSRYSKKVTSIDLSTKTGDIDLYAKFITREYTIGYNLNGGINSKDNPSKYSKNESIILAEPTKKGYEFLGWYTTADFKEGTEITEITPETADDYVLYANWEVISYTIEFTINDADDDVAGYMEDMEVTYDETVELTSNTYSKPGYVFAGWTDKDTGKSYADGAKVKNLLYEEGTVTLEAKWKKVSNYTIKYNLNGGSMPKGVKVATKYVYEEGNIIYLPEPTRKGYEFVAWYTTKDFEPGTEITEIDPYNDYQNFILYAEWKPEKYDINFYVSGEFYDSDTYEYSANSKDRYELEALERTGHTFSWYSDPSCKKAISYIARNSGKNVDVYGKFTPNTYKISYKLDKGVSNGAKNPTSYTYDENNTVYLKDPVNKGKAFEGWYYLDAEQERVYLSCDTDGYYIEAWTAENLTLYAEFSDDYEEYTITYIDDYGDYVENPDTYRYDTPTFKLLNPTRYGYTFIGWYNTANNKKVTQINKGSMGSIELEARYTPNVYTINFNKNGANSGSMKAISAKTGQDITIPANTFKKTGYYFTNWTYTDDDGNTYELYEGDTVSDLTGINKGKVNLNANWEPVSYTVTFNLDESVTGQDADDEESIYYIECIGGEYKKELAYNEELKLSSTMFSRTRSTITGWWYINSSGKKITLKADVSVKNLTVENEGNITLAPIWESGKYSVNYNSNGGTGTMASTLAQEGKPFNLAANTFKKNGYQFVGWAREEDGTAEFINKAKIETSLLEAEESSVTLYAVWEPVAYTLSFNKNGGTGTVVNASVKYDEEYTVTASQLRKGDKIFMGWAKSSKAVQPDYKVGDKIINLANTAGKIVTLYAVYGEKSLSIAFIANGTLGDKSFFDSAYEGIQRLNENYNDIDAAVIELTYDRSKWENSIEDIFESKQYDVIIAGTYDIKEYIVNMVGEYPDQKVWFYDEEWNFDDDEGWQYCPADNLISMIFAYNEGSYLVGYAAAMASKNNHVSFCGGMENSVLLDYANGFEQGAKAYNPDCTVDIAWMNTFSDSSMGKDIAEGLYDNGSDVIYACGGSAALGVYDAALEYDNVYVIGVDGKQGEMWKAAQENDKANLTLTSMYKNLGNAIYNAAVKERDNELVYGRNYSLGLEGDYVGYEKTDTLKTVLTAAQQGKLEKIRKDIASGAITVDSDYQGNGYSTISSVRTKEVNIGVCIYEFDDNFMSEYRTEINSYFEDISDNSVQYNVTVMDGKSDMAVQSAQIDELIASGFDALIINPVQPSAVYEEIQNRCEEAGIPTVFINREPEDGEDHVYADNQCYIGFKGYESGTSQGRIIYQMPNHGDINLNGRVDYVMITGDPGNLDAQLRTEYSIKYLTDNGIDTKCIYKDAGYWDEEQGKEIAEYALGLYGDKIDVIFCNNDTMAIGAYEAIVEAGRKVNKDIYLVGIDAVSEAVSMVKRGTMTGTVKNDPCQQADAACEAVLDYLAGRSVDTYQYLPYVEIKYGTLSHNITYVLNGGTNNPSNESSINEDIYYLAEPTRSGYIFDGWYYDSAFKKPVYFINSLDKENLTVYAKWISSLYKDSITYTYTSDISSFDYIYSNKSSNADIYSNGVEGLLTQDSYGNLAPGMAESWESDSDATVWTFNLRDDAYWVKSNGSVYANVKAQDFVTGLRHAAEFDSLTMWLVGDIIDGLKEYVNNKDWSDEAWEEVGIEAVDNYTVRYTLSESVPYFPSIATYSILYPVNKTFLESKGTGCKLGSPNEDYCSFGNVGSNGILYNSAYRIESYTNKGNIILTKNDEYWDEDNVFLNTVILKYAGNEDDPDYLYRMFKNGEVDFATVRTVDSTIKADAENRYSNSLYTTDTGTAVYWVALNVNRTTYTSPVDTSKAISPKAYNYTAKNSAKTALLNANFRRAIMASFSAHAYGAVSLGEENADKQIRNTIVAPTIVRADGELYVDVLTEKLQAYDGYENINLEDGQDAYYNPKKAREWLAKAKVELGNSVTWPIQLDTLCVESSDVSKNRALAVKTVMEEVLGKGNIQINIISCDSDTYYDCWYFVEEGTDTNCDLLFFGGWGPDHDDPSSYLNIFDPDNGDMIQNLGLNVLDKTTKQIEDIKQEVGLDTFGEKCAEADAIINDNDARVEKYAEAEAYLIQTGIVRPMTTRGGETAVSRIVPYTGCFGYYGWGSYNEVPIFKGMKVYSEKIVTTLEHTEAKKRMLSGN